MTVSNQKLLARVSSLSLPLTALAVSLSLSFSSSALAQDPAAAPAASSNCPPGSWFCAEAPAQAPAAPPAAPAPAQLQTLPNPEAKPAPAPTVVITQPAAAPPPVVIYQPAPPVMVVQPRSEVPPRYEYRPRPAPWQRQREWALTLHLSGVALGRNASDHASMHGLGAGLRYKPSPYAGIEANVDFYGGTDFNGYDRGEVAYTFNGLVYLNPKSKAQVYFLGGLGITSARVDDERSIHYRSADYTYFGGQIGLGLELRLAKHFALSADVRGFLRGRIDSGAAYSPEFRDSSGRTTNTSGGGLFTGGMIFYF